jgi:methionyl-tRNA formyltransferase
LKILFLGPDNEAQNKVIEFLNCSNNKVSQKENKLDILEVSEAKYDYLISFGYRHILKENILNYFDGKAINLHASFLPWNKGADPNLWSILESTPKGVTIHQMDCGLDTGKILCQEEIFFDKDDTLKSSYEKLQVKCVELFKLNWEKIKSKIVKPIQQKGKGSYHKPSDKNNYMELLTDGWDTKVTDLGGKAINDKNR